LRSRYWQEFRNSLGVPKSGAELRQAREDAGLLAEQIADRTKIKLHKIIALERGDWNSLPQGIYLDGIVRAYAREVNIDAEPIVELVRLERGKLPGDTPIAFQERVEFERPLPADENAVARAVPPRPALQRRRLAFAVVVLIAIAGWGAYIYERTRASDRDTAGKISTPAPQARPQNSPVTLSENPISTHALRSEDVSGAWRLATHVESSTYARFEGLQLG
jgi:cytoskeletal protein RodZ